MKTSTDLRVRHALSGPTMGTRYSAVFYAEPGFDTSALSADLQSAVDRVDDQMSTWKPQSALSRFNRGPVGAWIDVPRTLLHVVDNALAVGRASGGAFDIGVGAAVDAYGFGPAGTAPDALRIARLDGVLPPAHDVMALDHSNLRMRREAAVSLDLSGIAKGFAVDELARVMDAHGIGGYLVGIDGELSGRGVKPGGLRWAVGLERPEESRRSIAGVVELADSAIATSGDYRHRTQWLGKAISHTIDPRTWRPVDGRVASVTVLHPACMIADAWATALMVMGEDDGPAYASAHGLDALFLLATPGGLTERRTGSFSAATDGAAASH